MCVCVCGLIVAVQQALKSVQTDMSSRRGTELAPVYKS